MESGFLRSTLPAGTVARLEKLFSRSRSSSENRILCKGKCPVSVECHLTDPIGKGEIPDWERFHRLNEREITGRTLFHPWPSWPRARTSAPLCNWVVTASRGGGGNRGDRRAEPP